MNIQNLIFYRKTGKRAVRVSYNSLRKMKLSTINIYNILNLNNSVNLRKIYFFATYIITTVCI